MWYYYVMNGDIMSICLFILESKYLSRDDYGIFMKYQLIKREFSPGNNSEWNKRHLYLRFYSDHNSGQLLQGGTHHKLVPYQYQFDKRHNPHKYNYDLYEDAICTVDFTKYLPTSYNMPETNEYKNSNDMKVSFTKFDSKIKAKKLCS